MERLPNILTSDFSDTSSPDTSCDECVTVTSRRFHSKRSDIVELRTRTRLLQQRLKSLESRRKALRKKDDILKQRQHLLKQHLATVMNSSCELSSENSLKTSSSSEDEFDQFSNTRALLGAEETALLKQTVPKRMNDSKHFRRFSPRRSSLFPNQESKKALCVFLPPFAKSSYKDSTNVICSQPTSTQGLLTHQRRQRVSTGLKRLIRKSIPCTWC